MFENFVVVKNDEFRRKVNTEFFGVDIPVYSDGKVKLPADKPSQTAQMDTDDGFFMTGVNEDNIGWSLG